MTKYIITYDGPDFDHYIDRFSDLEYKRLDFDGFTMVVFDDPSGLEEKLEGIPNIHVEKESSVRYSEDL